MEFKLTKDYLGLSDVIFVNEECQESEGCEGRVNDYVEDTTERKQDDNPKVKRASLQTPNMTGEFQRRALSSPEPSAEARSMGHVQWERSKNRGEHYETQNMFQQLLFSPRERYEISNVFQQRQTSPIEQEQNPRNQCRVTSLRERYQPPQRPTSLLERYQPPQRPTSPLERYQPPQLPTSLRERYQPPQRPTSLLERYQPPQLPTSPRERYQPPQLPTSPRERYQPPQRPVCPRERYQPPQLSTSPRERYQPPQLPTSPRERYQPPQLPTSPGERYQPPQLSTSPRERYQPPQLPTSPRNRYQPPDVFQQRTFNPDERYTGTRMPVTEVPHYSESYACAVPHAKRTRKTSAKQQCQIGRTGQVHLCEVSEMRPKFHMYQIDLSKELRSGCSQPDQTYRDVGTERPKCTKIQYNTSVSEGNADSSASLRPFSIQMSDTLSRYPSPPVPVDVTGSQWSTKSMPNAKSYKHECKFCKTNGERKVFYMSHDLKDAKGRVTCPVLRTFRCPICKATGDYAHTVTYCPFGSGQCSVMVTSKTPRMSCGRARLLDH